MLLLRRTPVRLVFRLLAADSPTWLDVKLHMLPRCGTHIREQRTCGGGCDIAREFDDDVGVCGHEGVVARRADCRVEKQPGLGANGLFPATLFPFFAQRGGPPALPHNRVRDRLARGPVPHHHCFPLIGDAQGRNLLGPYSSLAQRLAADLDLRLENLCRGMLHPTRLGVVLGKLPLRRRHNLPALVKNERPATRRPLVEAENVGHAKTGRLRLM